MVRVFSSLTLSLVDVLVCLLHTMKLMGDKTEVLDEGIESSWTQQPENCLAPTEPMLRKMNTWGLQGIWKHVTTPSCIS
jgi:hypothetical protein